MSASHQVPCCDPALEVGSCTPDLQLALETSFLFPRSFVFINISGVTFIFLRAKVRGQESGARMARPVQS